MQELDFALDGVIASDIGIKLCSPIKFSPAVPRAENIIIPGKNGDLHYAETGVFNNRKGEAECFAFDGIDVVSRMGNILAFLFEDDGTGKVYRKLTVSDDNNHYWEARVSNGGEIAARLNMLAPFTIEFDCKPFRVVKGYDSPITITSADYQITNPTGFTAYPLIYVSSASGNGFVDAGAGRITFAHQVTDIVLDCEEWRAYSGSGSSADMHITGETYPCLFPGRPHIYSNDATFSILPRWHEL